MANPYRNTGKAGTGNPVNFNLGGTLAKVGKALLKKFTKSKPVSNFKPFHRDGVTYDTKMINDAFEQRFGRPQNVIKEATEEKDALTHYLKVKKMASNAGPKNSWKGLNESPKKRTNFGGR